MPVGDDSTMRVSLLRSVPGPNLDFATFSFQVPTKGSVCATVTPEIKKAKARTAASSQLGETPLPQFVADCSGPNCESTVGRISPANDEYIFILAISKVVVLCGKLYLGRRMADRLLIITASRPPHPALPSYHSPRLRRTPYSFRNRRTCSRMFLPLRRRIGRHSIPPHTTRIPLAFRLCCPWRRCP